MKTREDILQILKTHKDSFSRMGVSGVGLFGSYVRNEQSPESDIDLLLEFEPAKETFENYMAVCDLVESIFGNEKTEIVTKNGLSKHIGPKILSEVLYV